MFISKGYDTVLILLADRFNELFAINTTVRLRSADIQVVLVGLTAGLLHGQQGITIRPDLSLSQLLLQEAHPAGQLLILCGDQECVSTLLVDPRVHQLISSVLDAGGQVTSPSPLLKEVLTATGRLRLHQAGQLLPPGEPVAPEFTGTVLPPAGVGEYEPTAGPTLSAGSTVQF